MKNTSFYSTMVYGSHVSLMQSSRPPGYHSKPHYHESEQINLVLEGELYFYTDTAAYLLQPGDVLRVPPNVIHWAQNRGDKPFVQITVHSPSFHRTAPNAVALLAEDEDAGAVASGENIYVEPGAVDVDRIEAMPPVRVST